MSKLFLMCGIPGSGKSTWIKKHLKTEDAYISRDEIRFDMLEDGDDYFANEDKVFKKFYEQINWALNAGFDNVFVDATHISKASRRKILYRINAPRSETSAIWIKTPLEQTLIQNEQRSGLALVPKEAILSMNKNFQPPSFEEGFDKIYIVEPNKNIVVKVKEKLND